LPTCGPQSRGRRAQRKSADEDANTYRRPFGFIAWLLLAAVTATAQSDPPQAPSTDASPTPSTTAAAFDAITIKPNNSGRNGGAWGVSRNKYFAKNTPLGRVILQAYLGFFDSADRLKGAPTWVMAEPYDITAKVDDATADKWKGLKQAQQVALAAPLLRAMLEDRCKLVAHTEPTEIAAYALVIGKHGSKLKVAQPDEPKPAANYAVFEGDG
jgi:hypothetical protein